jgi:predicted phosphodiesterase
MVESRRNGARHGGARGAAGRSGAAGPQGRAVSRPARACAAVALLLFVPAAAFAADPLMGPWINRATHESARVLWVDRPDAGAGTVEWRSGTASGSARAAVSGFSGRRETLQTAVLQGLPPDAEIAYSIRSGDVRVEGSFRTLPPPGFRGPFRFIVYGDTRTYPERHLAVAEAMAQEAAIRFVVLSGDLVANGDDWDQWPEQFFDPARAFLRRMAFWPVRGNHEGSARLYKELFDLPGNEQWYAFDAGNVHVVALDSEVGDGEERAAQLAWLERDLAARRGDWTIVTYHRPTFNVGGHASDWGADDLLPILERHEVDVVITGHSHLYERFVPIGAEGKRPVIHVVSGGGGAPFYEVRPSPLLEGGIGYAGLHFCVFDVEGHRLVMTVKKPDGGVLDRMELVKVGGRFQPEVHAKAVDTVEARLRLKSLQGMEVEFEEGPEAGRWHRIRVSAQGLPKGSLVRARRHPNLDAWKIRDREEDRAEDGLALEVRAPERLALVDGKLDPPLALRLDVRVGKKRHRLDTGPLMVSETTLRRLTPAPAPVPLRRGSVTVDADASDWAAVPWFPAKGGSPSPFKFLWSADGLYGYAEVADGDVAARPKEPWKGDAVAVFLERDARRATKGEKNPNVTSLYVSPGDGSGPVDAHVACWDGAGGDAPPVQARSRRTPRGWAVEFLIPAARLAPARLAAGSTLGFNAVHLDGGDVKTSTCSDWEWHSPFRWGAVRLEE